MEKDIKQMIENIEVPMDKLDNAIQKGIKQSKVKPNKKRNIILLGTVAILGMILCSGFVSPKIGNVLADVPIIGFIYEIEEDNPGLYIAMEDENKITLNETINSNGVSITIEDIVYDGTRIGFTYYQEEYEEVYPLNIKINGEVINFSENLSELEAENGFRGLIQIFPEESLPDSFEIEVGIHQIGDTTGEWTFKTFIEKVHNHSKQLEVGQRGVIDNIHFEVIQAEKSDTGTNIEVEFKETLEKLFSMERVISVTITDQNGVPIMLDKKGSGNESGMVYDYLLAPLSNTVTELHMTHYFIPVIEEPDAIKAKLKKRFPQVISQGIMGDIVITNVQRLNDEYVMTFHSTSEFPFDASFFPNRIDVVDDQGNHLITDYPKGVGPNEYEVKFQAKSGDVWIHTYELPKMEIEESAKVVIPVE